RALAMVKFASGALRMPTFLRFTAAATTTVLLSFATFVLAPSGVIGPLGFGSVALASPAGAAQERVQERETKTIEKEKPAEPTPPPPKEEQSVTEHSIKLGGATIPYKAVAQTILLKNEKDEPQALIYSTTYTRTDVKDLSQRPISFIYNGGPGSASVWLHMGAFGPR